MIELNEKRNEVVIQKFKSQGDLRYQYLKAQNQYFKFFLKNHEARNDPSLYDYRRKIKSEIQLHVLRNIHLALFGTAIIYGGVRLVRSGIWSAILWAGGTGLYILNSLYNTGARYPFEIAYPPHPLVAEKREEAINRWWYYQPEIIKFELEYLNK